MKRSLDTPRPAGAPPPAKVLKEGQSKDMAGSGGGKDAPSKSGSTATHEFMTPESTSQASADRQTQQGAHFSGYQDDRAHISSNPFVESDKRLKDVENQHNLPERVGVPHTREGDSLPTPLRSGRRTSQGTDDSRQNSTTLAQMLGDKQRTEEGGSELPDSGAVADGQGIYETKGDREGNWTARVQELRKHADSRGANLGSMNINHQANFRPDPPGTGHRVNPETENDVHGQEATMALYSYPRLESGRRFFAHVPEQRKEELEKVRRDLKDMEDQLRNTTKQRIDEVSATLDTGSPGGISAPHGSVQDRGFHGGS